MNGIPHKALFAISRHEVVIGIDLIRFPIHRKSCACLCVLIIFPAQINNSALNKA